MSFVTTGDKPIPSPPGLENIGGPKFIDPFSPLYTRGVM